MNALATMWAVAAALMLAGCGGGGGSSPLAGMPGGEHELEASGSGGTGPVAGVGEGGGTSLTAPGGGSEGGETGPVARVGEGSGTSWVQFKEQLEGMSDGVGYSHPTRQTVQEMLQQGAWFYEDEEHVLRSSFWDYHNSPSPYAVMKSRIAAARELPGPKRRFQGTLQSDELFNPRSSLQFWGGWLDNSGFYAGTVRSLIDPVLPEFVGDVLVAQSIGRPHAHLAPSSIEDPSIRDEFVGVYRGEAVDMEGNWGTSEVNLAFKLNVPTPQYADQDSGTATVVDLTIDIPAYGERSWRDGGSLGWAFSSGAQSFRDTAGQSPGWAIGVGPGGSRMTGEFYDGKEVGGVFQFLHAGDLVMGAFGAKKVP